MNEHIVVVARNEEYCVIKCSDETLQLLELLQRNECLQDNVEWFTVDEPDVNFID